LTILLLASAGELALRWNQIWPSLFKTYEKLKALGYEYTEGKIYIIDKDEMKEL